MEYGFYKSHLDIILVTTIISSHKQDILPGTVTQYKVSRLVLPRTSISLQAGKQSSNHSAGGFQWPVLEVIWLLALMQMSD